MIPLCQTLVIRKALVTTALKGKCMLSESEEYTKYAGGLNEILRSETTQRACRVKMFMPIFIFIFLTGRL